MEHEDEIPARPGATKNKIKPKNEYDESDLIEQRPAEQVTTNIFTSGKAPTPKKPPPGQADMRDPEESVGSVPSSAPEAPGPNSLGPEELAQVLQMLQSGIHSVGGPMSLNPVEASPTMKEPVRTRNKRVIYHLDGGHAARMRVVDVVVTAAAVVVITDEDGADTMLTPALGRLKVEHEGEKYFVIYAGVEFEYDTLMFQVFQRYDDDEQS